MQALLVLFLLVLSLPAMSSGSAGCPSPMPADWLAGKNPLAMPIRPAHCETVNQTPPDFSWPDSGSAGGYAVELTGPVHAKKKTGRNWINWGEALPPGEYQWRVIEQGVQGKVGRSGVWRRFAISADAMPFVVPDDAALIKIARQRERPRSFYSGDARAAWIEAIVRQRRVAWSKMLEELSNPLKEEAMALELVKPSRDKGTREYALQLANAKQVGARVGTRLLNADLAWMGTRNPVYLSEAKRLLNLVSSWDPRGPTGVAHHQVAGQLTWILALSYDWLYPELNEVEQRRTLDAIAVRMDDLLAEFKVVEQRRLEKTPYNSHGWVALGEMAAASALLVGDDPRAAAWFKATVPAFIQSVSPWGWHAGGMGNGTAYGTWDLMALMPPMDILREVLGVNVYQKAAIRNLGRFNAYFMPPGGGGGLFGDGTEIAANALTEDYLRAFALRVPDSFARWTSTGRNSKRPSAFIQLFAPPNEWSGEVKLPAGAPMGMLAESTGWFAMHSDLQSLQRVSVYFRSSPYGSYNHSHASQNGFVVDVGGKRVLKESGYYDFHGSPHQSGWYQRTVAHNAMTFDGGQGQKNGDRGASGHVTFHSTNEAADAVTGDATRAYDGQVSKALRTLVFERPATLIVFDQLESPIPRSWEWNIHADETFRDMGNGLVAFPTPQGEGCLEVISSSIPVEFSQHNVFDVMPQTKSGGLENFPPQWHGVFKTKKKSAAFVMATAIHMDCAGRLPIEIKPGKNAFDLSSGGMTWRIDADGRVLHTGAPAHDELPSTAVTAYEQ